MTYKRKAQSNFLFYSISSATERPNIETRFELEINSKSIQSLLVHIETMLRKVRRSATKQSVGSQLSITLVSRRDSV